jgi:hypothetical protein
MYLVHFPSIAPLCMYVCMYHHGQISVENLHLIERAPGRIGNKHLGGLGSSASARQTVWRHPRAFCLFFRRASGRGRMVWPLRDPENARLSGVNAGRARTVHVHEHRSHDHCPARWLITGHCAPAAAADGGQRWNGWLRPRPTKTNHHHLPRARPAHAVVVAVRFSHKIVVGPLAPLVQTAQGRTRPGPVRSDPPQCSRPGSRETTRRRGRADASGGSLGLRLRCEPASERVGVCSPPGQHLVFGRGAGGIPIRRQVPSHLASCWSRAERSTGRAARRPLDANARLASSVGLKTRLDGTPRGVVSDGSGDRHPFPGVVVVRRCCAA